jgi:alkanesulfonate monooxygenase SsuD/methylene tetrahydromethanopterin reductase-like flavin-dependent oxidoreductase (luciferase family)
MKDYLDTMAEVQYGAPLPQTAVPLVLAALGPRMLELAAERADGAHPYFVPARSHALRPPPPWTRALPGG